MPANSAVMQPADYETGARRCSCCGTNVGKKLWRRSGIVNKTFVLNGESRTLIELCPKIWMGRCGYVIPAKPPGRGRTVAGVQQAGGCCT